jgi:glycosyltransferase involved in cell wall biosynthesis
VVPVYNAEAHLGRCLDSLRAQTVREIEVIMVDDGSTDSSGEICRRFAATDSRFIHLRQDNRGVSAARNAGLVPATGRYVAFVDADDHVDADYCEQLCRSDAYGQADLLVFGYVMDDGAGSGREYLPEAGILAITDENRLEYFCRRWLSRQQANYVWNKLYRREFLERRGARFPENVSFGEDRHFNYQLLPRLAAVAQVACAPYHYFQHDGSLCRTHARNVNIVKLHLWIYLDIANRWRRSAGALNEVRPVVLLRMLRAAFFYTLRALDDSRRLARQAAEAFSGFSLERELDLRALGRAMAVYAGICGLDWAQQSQLWLFALSLLGGEEGICAWQRLAPEYSALVGGLAAEGNR